MSWEINPHEELKINNANGEAADAVAKLAEYIYLLRDAVSIEMDYCHIKLQVDGESAELLNDELLPYGAEPTPRFPQNHPLMALAQKLEGAEEITFTTLLTAFARLDKIAGLQFWREYLQDKQEELGNSVQYRCVEYYDVEPKAFTFVFNSDMCGEAAYDAAAEDVAEVENWFSYNFSLGANGTEDLADDAADELMELLQQFAEEFELDEPEELNDDDPVLQCGVNLTAETAEAFAANLNAIAKAFKENGLELVLEANFVADGEGAFAVVDFVAEEGNVKPYYCRF